MHDARHPAGSPLDEGSAATPDDGARTLRGAAEDRSVHVGDRGVTAGHARNRREAAGFGGGRAGAHGPEGHEQNRNSSAERHGVNPWSVGSGMSMVDLNGQFRQSPYRPYSSMPGQRRGRVRSSL